jgi:hypothetical protein
MMSFCDHKRKGFFLRSMNSPWIADAYVKVMSAWVKRAMIASITRTLGVRPSWIREESMASIARLVRVNKGRVSMDRWMDGWMDG